MTKLRFSPNADTFQSHTKQLRISRTLTAQYYAQLNEAAKKRAADAKLPKDRDGRIRSQDRKGMLPADYIAHLRWMLAHQDVADVAAATGRSRGWLANTRDCLNRPEIAPAFSQEWHDKLLQAQACTDGKAVP